MESYTVGNVDIKDIQAKMLGIMLEIDRICKKYHLRYLLDGGTMLGAVRHRGFIPWDNDADVMMPRDDYEEFMKAAKDELRPPYIFQCMENTDGYPYNFGKVFDTQTTYTESFTANAQISHGIYVDVFPMDYVDENYLKHAEMIAHYTMLRYYKLGLAHGAKRIIARFIPLSFINKRATSHMKYYGVRGKKVCKLCHHGKNKPPIDLDLFNETVEVPYENTMLRVPAAYDSFLTGRYGDYMQLPPEKDRIPCHHVEEVKL